MTEDQLKQKGAIYVTDVLTGMSVYSSYVVHMGRVEAKKWFLQLREKNGEKNSFLDFYYFRLKKEEQKRVDSCLTSEECLYLKEMAKEVQDDIIFQMEEKLLDIAVKLNEMEMLFSTFYYTGEKSTWWGNYGKEYVVFWDKGKCPVFSCVSK